MKQSGLACVIEAQEEDFSFFLPQTERGKDAIEPVEEEHGGGSERRNGKRICNINK